MRLVLGANLLMAPAVAVVVSPALGVWLSVTWALALSTTACLRWWWISRLQAPRSRSGVRSQEIGYAAGSFASGVVWGVLGIAASRIEVGFEPVLITMFIAGMVAGAIGSLSTIPTVYWSFSIPALLPISLLYAIQDTSGEVVYGFASLLFLAVNLGYSLNIGRTILRSIELRFENEDLIQSLTAARKTAEQENELKSRFLQSAGHDLKQPLHAVTLLLADLDRHLSDDGRRTLARAQQSVLSLGSLLERLLEASSPAEGRLAPKRADVPLADLLSALAFEFGAQAETAGISVRFRPTALTVETDELLLTQVLRNYVSNALRHGRRRVLVAARRRGTSARIEVWDDGAGIPAGQLTAIYEPFLQLRNKARDARLGYGLGLAIVATIAKHLGARHGVASREGRGSVFWVEVALARDGPPVVSRGPETAPARASAAGRRVLVVEDDPVLLQATADLISNWGFEVRGALDGEAALNQLDEGFEPTVLVTDFRLPGDFDGLMVSARLADRLGRPLPTIVVTGERIDRDVASRDGIIVLGKPVIPGRLLASLTSLAGGGTSP
ncbi:ATP-binding response regulator [Chthonobacter rhizosphaerae]|uniref:ATP-binding response regulator n=1 Tax=Chthonobacter rhizosphaerae TaxID=2735553 RepID=UPI0015EE51F2|nr:hybrid sensor histidine kinase/response regulator [Chthonobacter rhizosphaerae]